MKGHIFKNLICLPPYFGRTVKTNLNRENCQMHCCAANFRHPIHSTARAAVKWPSLGPQLWNFPNTSSLSMNFFLLRKARNHTLYTMVKLVSLKIIVHKSLSFKNQAVWVLTVVSTLTAQPQAKYFSLTKQHNELMRMTTYLLFQES